MEVLEVNVAMVTGLGVIVMGIVQWFKTDTMPSWAIRLISLGVSYAIVGLILLVNPMTWQLFIVNGAAVFLLANGIWQGADQVGIAIAKNSIAK